MHLKLLRQIRGELKKTVMVLKSQSLEIVNYFNFLCRHYCDDPYVAVATEIDDAIFRKVVRFLIFFVNTFFL